MNPPSYEQDCWPPPPAVCQHVRILRAALEEWAVVADYSFTALGPLLTSDAPLAGEPKPARTYRGSADVYVWRDGICVGLR